MYKVREIEGLWYVLARDANGNFAPITQGYDTKQEAEAWKNRRYFTQALGAAR